MSADIDQLSLPLDAPGDNGDLPRGWTLASVEDLGAPVERPLTDGPFGSNLKTAHYTDAGPRVIRLENIGDGAFIDTRTHISAEHFEKLRKHEALEGDLVVAMLGTDLPRACQVPPDVGPAIVKADCVRLRVAAEHFLPRYVMYAINCRQTRERARRLVHGVGRPRLGLKLFRRLLLPVAPKREQAAIVDTLDEKLTELDAAVVGLKRVQANLKRYRASVLKAAVEGRLVPTEAKLARQEGRYYEPASVLLERLLVERRQRWEQAEFAKMNANGKPPKNDKWKAKYKEPATPDTTNLPDLPEGWCWTTVESVCSHVVDCLHKTPKYQDDGLPAIRTADVVSGQLLLDQARRVSPEVYGERVVRLEPQEGDVLYTREGERYGLAAVVPENVRLCLGQRMMQFRILHPVMPAYFMWALNSPLLYGQAATDVGGSTSPHVNIGSIRQFALPLAPLEEQRRIVEKVEDHVSIADHAESAAFTNRQKVLRLRQAILKWAFEGKLVDQDLNDEPASELLERIREQRAAAEPTKKTKRRRKKKTASP